jgi:thymidine kinase
MHTNPQFIVFCGPMFSSKTSSMLAHLDRCKYQKKTIVAFKPIIDDRYSQSKIVTHGGWAIDAVPVESGAQIIKHLAFLDKMPDVIAVDELFMIPGAAKALIWLFRTGIDVVVSTLDMSAACKPFKEVELILPWATKIKKLTAVCVICGADAAYSYRKSEDTDEIVVGGAESYECRCSRCHTGFKLDEE